MDLAEPMFPLSADAGAGETRASWSVLVVEDDPGLRLDLVEYLQLQGWRAMGAASAADMWAALQNNPFDLLVLDLGLPDAYGLTELPKIRLAFGRLPIAILSAFSDIATRIQCLEAGADLYLVKDASLELIHASCHALVRRSGWSGADWAAEPAPAPARAPQAAEADADTAQSTWQLHHARCCLLTPDGATVELSLAELQLLQCLMARPGETLPRESLLRSLAKIATLNNQRNLDGSVARLRRKVDQVSSVPLPVRSFYGRGYAFMGNANIVVLSGSAGAA